MVSMHVFGFLLLLFSCNIVQVVSGSKCPPIVPCGDVGNVRFPFTTAAHPECGVLVIHGCDDEPGATKSIQNNNRWFDIVNGSLGQSTMTIRDAGLSDFLLSRSCEVLGYESTKTFTVDTPLASSNVMYSANLLRCNHTLEFDPRPPPYLLSNSTVCGGHTFYGITGGLNFATYKYNQIKAYCSIIHLPLSGPLISEDTNVLLGSLTADIPIQITLSPNCSHCNIVHGGQCRLDNYGKVYCDTGTCQSCLISENF